MGNKEKNIDIMTTKVESSQKKSIDKEKNINKEQIRILEKDKIESDISTDVDSTDQRKQLALEVQKTPYVQELNNLKPAVMSNTAALGNTTDNTKEDQESWFSKNKALLLGAGGIGLGAWLLKPWNWFSDKDESKESSDNKKDSTGTTNQESKDNDGKNITVNVDNRDKRNRFQRNRGWMLGGAGIAGAAGYYFKDKLYKIPFIGKYLDDLFGPDKLKFNEALNVVEAKVKASASENHLKVPSNLQRNETDKTLTAFDHPVKVDIENRKIEGLDITFKTYEELIATVMIIGAAKNNYSGICVDNAVFSTTGFGGDIQVRLSKDKEQELVSGQGAKVGAATGMAVGSITSLVAGYFLGPKAAVYTAIGAVPGFSMLGSATLDYNDTLSQVAPTLNDGVNKERLCGYLNDMKCRSTSASTQESLQEVAKTENDTINKKFVETLQNINDTKDENDESGRHFHGVRKPSIDNYKDKNGTPYKDIIELKSRDNTIYFKIETDDQSNIKKVIIENSGIEFTGPNAVSQALHLGLFISKSIKELAGKSKVGNPFEYRGSWGIIYPGIYFGEHEFGSWDPTEWYERKYKNETIEKVMPDLLKGESMRYLMSWLNSMESMENNSNIWVEGGKRKNTYIEKLHTKKNPIKTKPTSQVKKAA